MIVRFRTLAAVAVSFSLLVPTAVAAQEMQPAGSAEQREAIAALSFMDGEWRGRPCPTDRAACAPN